MPLSLTVVPAIPVWAIPEKTLQRRCILLGSGRPSSQRPILQTSVQDALLGMRVSDSDGMVWRSVGHSLRTDYMTIGMQLTISGNTLSSISVFGFIHFLFGFSDQLKLNMEEHPLLFCEPTRLTDELREKLVENIFETYTTPATFLAKNSVLSSFASGRQTSLVADCGYAGSTSTDPLH